MITLAWIGNCYNRDGSYAPHPDVTYSDGEIKLSAEVFGSLRVRYSVLRIAFVVQIRRREGEFEHKYDSVAYVVLDNGVEFIEIESPANFEKFDGDCQNGAYYGVDGTSDGSLIYGPCSGYKYPVAARANRYKNVDYCSQIQIDETTYEIIDSEWEDCD
jgi:hypothetical protein